MYCFLLDHGLTVRPDGSVAPCCQWHTEDSPTIDENWKQYFEEKQKAFKNGWIPECQNCKTLEDRGEESERIDWLDGHDFAKLDKTPGRKHWDLKLHHTCNLTCRMCGPYDSSSWQKIIKYNIDQDWDHVVTNDDKNETANKKFGWRHNIADLLSKGLDDVRWLKFTGGEPMMIPQVKQVIKECVDRDLAPNVILKITSNATFPITKDWQDLFKEFKHVSIGASVNGIKSRYEYIRQNAVWKETYRNVMTLQDLGYLSCIDEVDQILIFDMKQDIIDFWTSKDIKINWGTVTRPEYHSLNALPDHLLKKYNWPDYYKFNQLLWNRFLKQTAIHDKIYNKDIRKEIPELFT